MRRLYETAHKAVCIIIHVHATPTLPFENNKYVFFKSCDLRALLHKSLDFWYYCYLCFTNRSTESTGLCSAGSQNVCALWWCLMQGAGTAALLFMGKTRHLWLLQNRWFQGAAEEAVTKGWEQWVEGLEWRWTILFMIKGPKQCQSCGKWISVCLTPDLSWNLVPHKRLLGSCAPKIGVLSNLSPGSDGVCWIPWCLCVAWKESGDRCGPTQPCWANLASPNKLKFPDE